MESLTYILDTNAISDYLNQRDAVRMRVHAALSSNNRLYLAQPVHYEVSRGLLKVGATRELVLFEDVFVPQLNWLSLTDSDWRQAAGLWVGATDKGRQLSDIDCLIAALALRLNAVVVTSDNDFDALPVKRENWRE